MKVKMIQHLINCVIVQYIVHGKPLWSWIPESVAILALCITVQRLNRSKTVVTKGLGHLMEWLYYTLIESDVMWAIFRKTSVPRPTMGIRVNPPPRNSVYAREDGNPKPWPEIRPPTAVTFAASTKPPNIPLVESFKSSSSSAGVLDTE